MLILTSFFEGHLLVIFCARSPDFRLTEQGADICKRLLDGPSPFFSTDAFKAAWRLKSVNCFVFFLKCSNPVFCIYRYLCEISALATGLQGLGGWAWQQNSEQPLVAVQRDWDYSFK